MNLSVSQNVGLLQEEEAARLQKQRHESLDRVPRRVQALHDVLAEITVRPEATSRPAPHTHQDQKPEE